MEKKTTILYIDDEPINLMLFERVFKRKYNIITALSGSEGIDIMRSNSLISAVISDMKMPGMNGIEFISKAKDEFPNKSFFILTGYSITEEIDNALSNSLIIKSFKKPFNIGEIEAELDKCKMPL
jgi:two-component system, response regulator, stage 0 sporulation protein F